MLPICVSSPVETWHFGGGDPTVAGWALTAGYLLTAARALLAARATQTSRHPGVSARPWWWIAGFTGLLGINKQLDLQRLAMEWGRTLSNYGGWYDHRRIVEKCFFAVAGIILLPLLVRFFRQHWKFIGGHSLMFCGVALVLVWCGLRAADILHVSQGSDSPDDRFGRLDLLEGIGVSMMLLGVGSSRTAPSTTVQA